ncbi:MAG TPA: DMT family transporter [Acidimicrobiales bacterium]|nr:DMT family transporter [Acidimicrobiales bacterium]
MLVVGLSLLAALAFAVGAVLQQHAAAGQPAERHMRPSLVLGLLQRPMWLAGIGMNAVGTLLQLAALWRGSLVTVQPLLVCGLLFALPINAIWLHRRRPGVRECASAGAVCIGLTAFLLATGPTPGKGTASAESWGIALAALGSVAALLVLASFRARGPFRPGLLAVAAGSLNGLSAAFIKGVAHSLEEGFHHGAGGAVTAALGNWELYAFAATLLLATLLVQSAYQAGPIRWSLPALTAANPVTSVLLGATVLSEQVHSGAASLTFASLGLALVVGGILALSSSSLITGEPAPGPASAVQAGAARAVFDPRRADRREPGAAAPVPIDVVVEAVAEASD